MEIVRKKIIEYDIQKCGMSILLREGYINKDTYNTLLTMDKVKSSTYISTYLRQKMLSEKKLDILKIIKKHRDEAVERFIWSNSVDKRDIIEINNDAIWTTKYCRKKDINQLTFVAKRFADILLIFKSCRVYYCIETGDIYYRNISEDKISDNVKHLMKALCNAMYNKYPEKIFKNAHALYKEQFINKEERDTILLS